MAELFMALIYLSSNIAGYGLVLVRRAGMMPNLMAPRAAGLLEGGADGPQAGPGDLQANPAFDRQSRLENNRRSGENRTGAR